MSLEVLPRSVPASLLQTRITKGLQNGRLNQQEAASLQAKLSQISAMEVRLRASGNNLSRGERNRLDRQLSTLSAQITRELNDFDNRRVGYWNFLNKVNGNGYGVGSGNGRGQWD